jgi:uncharacterized damage-inducible protein DinB
MNTPSLLKDYCRYNLWANRHLATVLRTIDQSWMTREITSSFPSLRQTCFHIWDAEYIWLCRLEGIEFGELPSKRNEPDLHGTEFVQASEALLSFIEKQPEHYFDQSTSFRTIDGIPSTVLNSGIILHVVNHSSFHRGQLVTMLRNLDHKEALPRTDMIVYLREKSSAV